ncbi:MAG: hypothetical protein FWD53_10500, partial [Phycisphaerales bacterium]|nr:hypothetical protein [Phycisphaerales bacterium]
QIRKIFPRSLGVLILPPSMDVLRRRLEDRKRDDAATIQRRLAEVQQEIREAEASGIYEKVVNEENGLDRTIETIKRTIEKFRDEQRSSQE